MPGLHYARPAPPSPPPPMTPSPTWSLSTLDFSVLVTPASAHVALPAAPDAQVHAALAYRPGAPLPLHYDAVLHPSTITSAQLDTSMLRRALRQGATNKAGPVVLRIDVAPTYSFFVTVFPGTVVDASSPVVDRTIPLPSTDPRAPLPTPSARGPFVTVHALLSAVHIALHGPVPDDERAARPELYGAVHQAMRARCAANAAEPRAVKRVDYLAAHGVGTRVLGLSSTKSGGHWVLVFR